MTPHEKAKDIWQKMYNNMPSPNDTNAEVFLITKQCALIAVDEVLNDDWFIPNREDLLARKEYWEEVKKEINNL